jgi:hypothetical protein
VAGHHLIEGYLAELARHLPAEAVDELADGLLETWQYHLAAGLAPATAARAAIAEFGSSEQVTTAFVTQAPGRRTARMLLATGPLVGLCWGVSLIVSRVWTWPVPTVAVASFAAALLAAAGVLAFAATGRGNYRRTRLGGIGGLGLVVLDAAMLAGVLLVAPSWVWPMAVAIPASVARIGLTVRLLPAALTR